MISTATAAEQRELSGGGGGDDGNGTHHGGGGRLVRSLNFGNPPPFGEAASQVTTNPLVDGTLHQCREAAVGNQVRGRKASPPRGADGFATGRALVVFRGGGDFAAVGAARRWWFRGGHGAARDRRRRGGVASPARAHLRVRRSHGAPRWMGGPDGVMY